MDAAAAPNLLFFFFSIVLLLVHAIASSSLRAELDARYYDKTCPQVEKIVAETVRNASVHDPKVPARVLRMFFHDCFVRGCDASVLLDSTTTGNGAAEKDAPPNVSLGAFYVIDDAKSNLESVCPGTVSCADVLAIAARDVVTMSGGPHWEVRKGRKDGRVSRASETIDLPSPSSNADQLIQSFARRGLAVKDLVALSGAHTLGFSHCSSFQARLRNFSSDSDVDPDMNGDFADRLRTRCPEHNGDRGAGEFLDSTASVFDNDYYNRLLRGEGVFASDQSLYGTAGDDYGTRWMVEAFARDEGLFFREFVASMGKLGEVGLGSSTTGQHLEGGGGEVRISCRVVN